MKNRIYTAESVQKLLAFILTSGLQTDKFKTELSHYSTKLSNKKEEAGLDRAIKNIVSAVNNLTKNPNSTKDKQIYESNATTLLALAQKYDAPDIYSVLANSAFVTNSPEAYFLFDKTISTYLSTLSKLEKGSKEFKECSLDLSRTYAERLVVGFLDNYHPYKSDVEKFLESVPDSKEGCKILSKMANMFESCQNSTIASKIYERLFSLNHKEDTRLKLIDAYHRTGQFDKAKTHILSLLEKKPLNLDLINLLVVNCVNDDKDVDLAEDYLTNFPQNNAQYYKNLSLIKLHQGFDELSLKILDKGAQLGFENELLLDYANFYYHQDDFEMVIKYFEEERKIHPNNPITEADYALSLMRNCDYAKSFKVFCEILEQSPHTLPTLSCYINTMQACLYSYGDEFVNLNDRSTKEEFEAIQNKYLEKTKQFENSLISIISLNYAEKARAFEIIKQTQEILHPTVNRHYLSKHDSSPTLTLDNLGDVFEHWLKEPVAKKIFTKKEIEQLKFDIDTAIKNKDNPYFSFAGCASNLNILVEKYVEPIYYYYLIERIGVLARKSARYEEMKNDTLDALRQKSYEKNLLLAERKHIPNELVDEIKQLTSDSILYSKKSEKLANKKDNLVDFRNMRFNLGHLYYLTTINSKKKAEEIKLQEGNGKEVTAKIRIINPAFGKFLSNFMPDDQNDKLLFALILQSNIEAYRFSRNDAVHANSIKIAPPNCENPFDEWGNPIRNWDSLHETTFVNSEIFLNLLNIALFSSNSIFSYLSDVNIEHTFEDKISQFFNQNSTSARNLPLQK